jgi:hypothetical protein
MMGAIVKRCKKFILPENYAGIEFNKEGICHFCLSFKKREYRGGDALKERILKAKNKESNRDFDCVIGLSGGRDSTYLLYYLTKVLNLKVLAYIVDNNFMPEQTKLNIKEAITISGVKYVVEKHNYLEKCIQHHMMSWIQKPAAGTIGMLCTGCRYGMDIGVIKFVKNKKVPIFISGGSPFERAKYKINSLKSNPYSEKNSSIISGYISHIMKNPKWIMKPSCFIMQIKEYYVHVSQNFFRKQKEFKKIAPFNSYIRWEEKKIMTTLENELNWKRHPGTESTWRGDCDIALLKLYLYKKILGYNDKDDELSFLIRDNQVSRKQALERVKTEGDIPERVIKEIFEKHGLEYSALKKVLKNL